MKIIFIQTGGTIDKDYPKTTKGYAFEFGEPATRRILEKLQPSFEYQIITSCQKDSLDITDDDRQKLVNLIQQQTSNKIIITHGTDTLKETAQFISKKIQDKIIVLTGAMRPERFSNSEADINLGSAIAGTQILENGVYITMHGVIKRWNQLQRNTETGQFF